MKSRRSETAAIPLRWMSGMLLSTGPVRATLKTMSVAIVMAIILAIGSGPRPGDLTFGLVVGPLCAMLCATTMRLWVGNRWTVALREAAVGTLVMSLVAVPGVVFASTADSNPALLIATFLFCWNLAAFAFFRSVAYLWPRWIGLRQSRLRWEMTHAILVVVTAVSSILILASVLIALMTGGFLYEDADNLSSTERLLSGLLALGTTIFLTVAALVVVLPPAAVVSYFSAGRISHRLESLAGGVTKIREGKYTTRVAVEGKDEVSGLQKDFNAMAEDLERSVSELRSERDNVERLLRVQRELVAGVSHELRTPVATMRGYLESALDDRQAEIPEGVRGDLEVMGREVCRLQRLIDDLFALSRAETGRLALDVQPTDVTALLGRFAEAVAESAWRMGRVEVICEPGANLPPVLADEGRLEQVVRNLLSNAIRHTPPGGIVVLTATAVDNTVAIEVSDTGEGIAWDDFDHIFERFYRSDGARQLDHTGAGLGLALVRDLTEAMGGSVSVESEPGAGSRFILRLQHA